MSGAPGLTVCAVVVTFDRRDVLEICLRAIRGQSRPPERVVVVDNGSRDATSGYLAGLARTEASLTVVRLAENLGPAGGFAAGLERALELGTSHLWVMDDDVLPAPGCLEAQLGEAGSNGMVFPRVFDEGGRETRYPGWSAVLIPAEAVRRGGVPERELFWWIEDTEYLQWRLPRRAGVEVRRAAGARARHGADRRGPKPAWKMYYEVRNTLYYRLHVQDTSWRRRGSRIAVVVTKSLLRALVRERHKLKRVRYILLGVFDGVRGRLGKTIDPAAG